MAKRRIRYQVACTLDGYIAAPNGEYDWIIMDPDIDFGTLFAQFDTLLMGRSTYEVIAGNLDQYKDHRIIVFSRTMRQADHAGITIVSDNIKQTVEELRAQPGKDIWLFGGGKLFQTLLELDCVDTIEPAIMPVLLGAGIPMFPHANGRHPLTLTGRRVYEKSGIVLLEYAVEKRTG